MTEARAIAEHGSRTIAALERAWAAIQDGTRTCRTS